MVTQSTIREVMSKLGSSRSKAKIAAAKRNGCAPCRKGKHRGRPRKDSLK